MKTREQMKKIIFFLLLNSLIIINAYTKQSYIKNRWNFKVGYSRIKTGTHISGNNTKKIEVGNYRISANYGILNFFEVGGYLGYSRFRTYEIVSQSSEYKEIEYTNTPFYGINANFHLLPFFISKDDFRFDLYVTGKFGGHFYFTPNNYYPARGHISDYGIGIGIAFYLWKHIGIFAEYNYGKYDYDNQTDLRYGLTLKF
ncbi:MAG: outer membrane beta-barrel protein [Bacteroidales bacterium]|nr:outer membrane beta-barrel protein [Bacteroidales bacterium]